MLIELTDQINFAFATVCQILNLSSAFLLITITFRNNKNLALTSEDLSALKLSWILEAFSILFGCHALMVLTGDAASYIPDLSIWSIRIRIPVMGQILCFFVAIVCLIAATWKSFKQ